jgi:hypothetical protein
MMFLEKDGKQLVKYKDLAVNDAFEYNGQPYVKVNRTQSRSLDLKFFMAYGNHFVLPDDTRVKLI